MSATVVGHTVINRVLTAAILSGAYAPTHAHPAGERVTDHNATEIGRNLLAETIAAVLYRYPHITDTERSAYAAEAADYRFERDPPASRRATAKTLGCLDYQSCEHPDWDKSLAYTCLRAFAFRLMTEVAYSVEVPKLVTIEKQVLTSPDQQISFTDPDSRSMATSERGSGVVGDNVQTAVDTENHLIIAHKVT